MPRLPGILVAAALAGCGGTQAPIMPQAPHGGSILTLPDGKGRIEVLRQESPEKAGESRLLVYCLDAEMKPLTPGATAANLKPRGRGGRPLELKPTNNPDPSRSGELASEPFKEPGEVSGELTLTIGDRPVTLAIGVH
jgi:hypothetical protein